MADFLIVINSTVNVVIYCIFKKEFRDKFFQMYVKCDWKTNRTPKNHPSAHKETAMIPMIRAQLPKTSVELTFAGSQNQQQAITSAHGIVNTY